MAKKCRHRKGLILASANNVEFTPDQEPYESGKIESCGIGIITADVSIHYCPICNIAHFNGFEDVFGDSESPER